MPSKLAALFFVNIAAFNIVQSRRHAVSLFYGLCPASGLAVVTIFRITNSNNMVYLFNR